MAGESPRRYQSCKSSRYNADQEIPPGISEWLEVLESAGERLGIPKTFWKIKKFHIISPFFAIAVRDMGKNPFERFPYLRRYQEDQMDTSNNEIKAQSMGIFAV